MIIKNVTLETVCGITSPLPKNERMEVAFAGKSNVGKSSMINALMNRKALARTSSQPGKTQTINFYNVNSEFYLVDLPGYGYAKVSQSEKEKWGKLIENYLHKSPMLKAVFLLIDIRHEPSANDKIMYDWIVSNGFDPHYHRHQAGQDQKKPDSETVEAGSHGPGRKAGHGHHPLLRGDQAGKRRDLGLY